MDAKVIDAEMMTVVEQTVLSEMQSAQSFTALDISNLLKKARYPVSHTAIAAAVRDIYTSGAMDIYQYRRRLIDVITNHGTQATQAFVYLPDTQRAQDYTRRTQNALPAVPPDWALPLPPALPKPSIRPRFRHRLQTRRDGALAVSRTVVRQMGWRHGDLLALTLQEDTVVVGPIYGPAQRLVRVWGEERIRISRRRLADLNLNTAPVMITAGAESLRLSVGP